MIAISRPLPPISSIQASSVLGFMPFYYGHTGPWVLIDRGTKSIALMDGQNKVYEAAGTGLEELKPGSYEVMHKQKSALWYAPDEYFMNRHLAMPAEGSKDRYRRGALGEYAIFIDQDTPIHSGPVWTKEVGGVQLSEPDISRLYYKLEVGAPIEIK